jgi:hypothetical protein
LENTEREQPANQLDDLLLGPAGGPSGLFPPAHLLDRNDWNLRQ